MVKNLDEALEYYKVAYANYTQRRNRTKARNDEIFGEGNWDPTGFYTDHERNRAESAKLKAMEEVLGLTEGEIEKIAKEVKTAA